MLLFRSVAARAAAALVGCAAIVAGTFLIASRADALLVSVPETGSPGKLMLRADPYPFENFAIAPGEPAYWLIEGSLVDEEVALLSAQVTLSGPISEHPQGVSATVRTCSVAWSGYPDAPVCTGLESVVAQLDPSAGGDSGAVFVGLLREGEPREFLVELAIAKDAGDDVMGLRGNIGIGLIAESDDPITPATVSPTPTPTPTPIPTASSTPTPTALPAAPAAAPPASRSVVAPAVAIPITSLPATGSSDAIGALALGGVAIVAGIAVTALAVRSHRRAMTPGEDQS